MKKNKAFGVLYALLGISVFVIVGCFSFVGLGLAGNKDDTDNSTITVNRVTAVLECDSAKDEFDGYIESSQKLLQMSADIKGVNVEIFFIDNYEEKPLVIVQHGLFSKKEEMEPFAIALAENGYLVVAPDAAGHGENKTDEQLDVMDLVERTADRFDTVIRYFSDSEFVNTDRTAVMGFSLGGLTSLYYAANGTQQPKVVVTFCATPRFESLSESSVTRTYFANGKAGEIMNEEEWEDFNNRLTVMSPYNTLLHNRSTKFLLICGSEDTIVPHAGNEQFYEETKLLSDNVTLIVREGQQHEFTVEDLQQALDYLNTHL